MNKIFIFSFIGIFFVSLNGFGQNEINQFDAQGERHGVWQKTYPNSNQLRYEGTFKHGKEIGVFKYYCESCKTQPSVIRTYKGDDGIAEVQYFTAKGKLVSEGKMKDKDRIGKWVYFQKKSGNVMTEEHYVNGKLNGKKITYFPNGKIAEEEHYSKGVAQGENNYYSPDGILLKKLKYNDGQLQGEALHYDAHGNLVIEGFYKEDKKYGLWKYYKNGEVVLEEIYPKPLNKS